MPVATDPATAKAMVWTCRLALAVAEQDDASIKAIVAEVEDEPDGGSLLLTTMAGTIASMMQELAGSNWRQAMRATVDSVRGS